MQQVSSVIFGFRTENSYHLGSLPFGDITPELFMLLTRAVALQHKSQCLGSNGLVLTRVGHCTFSPAGVPACSGALLDIECAVMSGLQVSLSIIVVVILGGGASGSLSSSALIPDESTCLH